MTNLMQWCLYPATAGEAVADMLRDLRIERWRRKEATSCCRSYFHMGAEAGEVVGSSLRKRNLGRCHMVVAVKEQAVDRLLGCSSGNSS